LEPAPRVAWDKKKKSSPCHIQLTIRNYEELGILMHSVTVNYGGELSYIHQVLLQSVEQADKLSKACSLPRRQLLNSTIKSIYFGVS